MAQLKDKNGKTEQEFLREYDVTRYFRPSVTVDAVLYLPSAHGGKVLLIKRGGHPYLGLFAFPGGFVDENEDCETAVARELFEETGISNVPLRQLVAASTPGRASGPCFRTAGMTSRWRWAGKKPARPAGTSPPLAFRMSARWGCL